MGQVEEKQSKGCSSSVVIAAIIAGVFAVIAALIGAYAVIVAADKKSSAPQQPDSSNASPTAAIAGTWDGTISSANGTFQTEAIFSIQSDCVLGQVCGTYDTLTLGCKGDLIFKGVTQDIYEFTERKSNSAADFCNTNGIDRFMLTSPNQLNVSYLYTDSQGTLSSSGILIRK